MLSRMRLAGIALASLGLLASAWAEPPSGLLVEMLGTSAAKSGDQLVGEAQGGELDDADEVIVTFEVDPGKTYKLFGVCDSDCTDLLISADDAKGEFIDTSLGQNTGTPVLEIDDFEGSTISVEVFMMNCKADPCAFAVSLAENQTTRNASRAASLAELSALVGGARFDGDASPVAESDEDLIGQLKDRVPDHLVPVDDIGTGKLGTGEAMRYFYEADPGAIYDAFAVCDCRDLNLVFRDDDDAELASDLRSDNRPGIEIFSDSWPRERRSGRQRLVLEVKMKDCGRDKCSFAAGVYKAK
jgi:hypothetical protein